MNKYKISEEEFHKVSLTRLANNPSSQSRYSGARLSAEELKERMDEPLKLFKGKLNAVVSLIFGEGDDSALDHMPTGIKEGHTLAQMIKDVVSTSAEFAGYLSVGEKTLLKKLEEIDKAFEDINNALKGKVDKKTYEDAIKQCLKRIDGEAGVEYAYAQRDGEGRLKPMSLSPTAESIALRGEGGRLKAGSPVEDDDVVTKEYADKTHYGASQIFASALKGSASGEAVALKDVSPLEHNLGVRVESKNLINPDWWLDCFTKQEDGSYLSHTTITTDNAWKEVNLPAAIYTFSGYIKSPTEKNYRLGVIYEDGAKRYINTCSNGENNYQTFTTDGRAVKSVGLHCADYSNEVQFKELMFELGTTATPYKPYIADTSGVKLLVQGANLLSLDKIIDWGNCSIENGVVTQTEADTSQLPYLKAVATFDSGEYELMGKSEAVTASGKVSFQITCAQEINKLAFGFNGSVIDTMVRFDNLSLPAGTYIASCNVINATQGSISWKDMQIALVDTEYESYKEPIEYAQGEDIKSIAPCTTIMTDTEGAVVEVEYNRDLNQAFAELYQAIISLGGNV